MVGRLDEAERMYRQAADADPRNSIAVVGLARVALERGDEPEAWRQARAALAIDPENVAARRLAERLEEVWAYRGESLPEVAGRRTVRDARDVARSAPLGRRPGRRSKRHPRPPPGPPAGPVEPAPPGVVDRLLRRKRP